LRRLDSELSHLTSAVASGGDLPVLLYEFSGRGSLGRLLAGTASSVSVMTPAGFIRNTSASASFDVVGEALAA